MANVINLIIDSREHTILRFLRDNPGYKQFKRNIRNIAYEIQIVEQTLPAGDYAISIGEVLKALFERKTLPDYAASLRDGRSDNKRFMKEARDKSRCDLYYIIEESPEHGYTLSRLEQEVLLPNTSSSRMTSIGGMPISSILASISHLTSRDKIFVATTQGILGTLLRLVSLAFAYASTNGSTIQQTAQATFAAIAGERQLHDDEILRLMFLAVPFISESNISELMGKTFTEVVSNPPSTLSARARTNLSQVTQGTWLRSLAVIPGVSDRFLQAINTSGITYDEMVSLTGETRNRLLTELKQKKSDRLEQIHRLLTVTKM